MFPKDSFNYSNEVKKLANEIVMQDIAYRAFWMSVICLFASIAYGVTSIDFINRFEPSITLWDNLYPRIILNSIPFFALALFLRKIK